jgi:hypothetical protein
VNFECSRGDRADLIDLIGSFNPYRLIVGLMSIRRCDLRFAGQWPQRRHADDLLLDPLDLGLTSL